MKTKKDANYKIIQGMRAVGNQCKDCANVVRHARGTMACKVLNVDVNHKGHCDMFHWAEEQEA